MAVYTLQQAIVMLLCLSTVAAQGQQPSQTTVHAEEMAPYRIGDGVSAPVPVYRPDPELPPGAPESWFDVRVTLTVVINSDGTVRRATVIAGAPEAGALNQEAVEAVRSWRFEPGMKNGNPVPTITNVQVHFKNPTGDTRESSDRPIAYQAPILATANDCVDVASPMSGLSVKSVADCVPLGKPYYADVGWAILAGKTAQPRPTTSSRPSAVSAPQLISKVEPELSDEARAADCGGTVVVAIVVDVDGRAKDIKVARPLGKGLDEKAVEAISKWRFRPGLMDGRPVETSAAIEVNFRPGTGTFRICSDDPEVPIANVRSIGVPDWAALYDGPITTSVKACFEVKQIPNTRLRYYVSLGEVAQFRLGIDGQQVPEALASTAMLGSTSIKSGRHELTLSVEHAVKHAKLKAILSNDAEGDVAGAVKVCDAKSTVAP